MKKKNLFTSKYEEQIYYLKNLLASIANISSEIFYDNGYQLQIVEANSSRAKMILSMYENQLSTMMD